jgi:hypothetical protein
LRRAHNKKPTIIDRKAKIYKVLLKGKKLRNTQKQFQIFIRGEKLKSGSDGISFVYSFIN